MFFSAVAVSGLIADAMTMVDKGRVEATNHSFSYEEPITVESLTKSLSNLALQFGDDSGQKKSSMSRPFGVAVIVAGIEVLFTLANCSSFFRTRNLFRSTIAAMNSFLGLEKKFPQKG